MKPKSGLLDDVLFHDECWEELRVSERERRRAGMGGENGVTAYLGFMQQATHC